MKKMLLPLTSLALLGLFALPGVCHAADVPNNAGQNEPARQEAKKNSGIDLGELVKAQPELKNAFSEILTGVMGVVSGMSAGMQEGAERGQQLLDGADGTKLVTNSSELAELVRVSFLRSEKLGEDGLRIVLAIRNDNDYPVRLTNLNRTQNVLLMDAAGFATEQAADGRVRIVNVPAKAAVKAGFNFSGLEGKARSVRLYGQEISIGETGDSN